MMKMFNTHERDLFEQQAHHYTQQLYNTIASDSGREITDWTLPDDDYSKWDMSATIDGEVHYIENKTRDGSYKKFKNEGYVISVSKLPYNDLFNWWFPQDDAVLVTTKKRIADLEPQEFHYSKKQYCDPDSGEGDDIVLMVPYNRCWHYRISDGKLINKPKKIN